MATSDDPDLCSGLAIALGRIPVHRVSAEQRQRFQSVLVKLYKTAPSGAVHSAAVWALQKWSVPLPKLPSSDRPVAGRAWFVDRTGQTLLQIPGGSFAMRAEYGGFDKQLIPQEYDDRPVEVQLSPFFIADREITVDLFQRFLNDPEYPQEEKPRDWVWGRIEKYVSPSSNCPVHSLSRDEAVLFCNWLSRRCGRRPFYRRPSVGSADEATAEPVGHSRRATGTTSATRMAPIAWELDASADGYRLPTEAQWEYACRAQSTTNYCFGNEVSLLEDYAYYGDVSQDHTWPVGSLQPNGWGLFDMHGNVAECCADAFTMRLPGGRDPCADPSSARSGVDRGGQWSAVARFCRSGARTGLTATRRAFAVGFRVVLPVD